MKTASQLRLILLKDCTKLLPLDCLTELSLHSLTVMQYKYTVQRITKFATLFKDLQSLIAVNLIRDLYEYLTCVLFCSPRTYAMIKSFLWRTKLPLKEHRPGARAMKDWNEPQILKCIFSLMEIKLNYNGPGPSCSQGDNAIHWINRYPMDKCWQNKPCYPLDGDLSSGKRSTFRTTGARLVENYYTSASKR